MDLGGGRGFLSRHILAETVKNLKVYDISETMLEQVYGTPGVNVEKHLLTKEIIDVNISSHFLILIIRSRVSHFSFLRTVKIL